MEAIMLGIIVVLLCTSLYFAYRYFSLKSHSDINEEVLNGMDELSAGRVSEQFSKFANNVNEKSGNLLEHGEYATEKEENFFHGSYYARDYCSFIMYIFVFCLPIFFT